MWPPEMCPIAYTAPTMTSMNANEIIPSCAIEKGTFVPAAITPVAAAAPAPTKTRKAVPRNSAASFCRVLGGAAILVARGARRRQGRGAGAPHLLWRYGGDFETRSTSPNNVSENINARAWPRQEGNRAGGWPGQEGNRAGGW